MPLNKQSIELVEAQESDRAFFVSVHHAAYRSVIEAMFGWDAELQVEYANTAFDSKNIHLICLDGVRVGVVGFDFRPDHVWLKQLFILPDYQRNGVGSFTVSQIIGIARTAKKALRLQTLKSNSGAVKFYQKLGFELEDETEVHWKLLLPYT